MEAYDVTRRKIEEAKSQSKSKFFQEEIINQEMLDNLDISATPYNTILATKVAKEQEKMANLPPIRSSGTVEFEFSERNFPGIYLNQRAQSFTSLKADLYQGMNGGFAFSRCYT